MDATKSKQAWLSAIVGNVSDLIAVYNDAGEIVYATPSIARFAGVVAELVSARVVMASVHPDDRRELHEAFDAWAAGCEMAHPVNYRARHADGSWHELEAFGRHFVDDDGDPGVVVTSRDCTPPPRSHSQLSSECRLQEGIDRNEFIVYYQPQVDLATGELMGFEALARWQDPERGLITPDGFICLAESTGLIVPLGRSILRQACLWTAQRGADLPAGARRPFVSVNVSARQLSGGGLVEEVVDALAFSGLDAGLLWLEITETMLMNDLAASRSALDRLRALGVHLSIDDFGTGWSSLAYLKRFPVEQLKVDRSFTAGVGGDAEDTSIVTAVIAMAHSLGISVVAEGVETTTQLDALTALGCDVGQGFLWSRPMPADEAASWRVGDSSCRLAEPAIVEWTEPAPRHDTAPRCSSHSVEFFERGAFPARALAERLLPVFDSGELVLLVISARHRDMVEAELVAAGVQLDAARRRGRYIAIDANEAVDQVLVDGRPDRERFQAVVGRVVNRLGSSGPGGVVCREMVARLDNDADIAAAAELESLWNQARAEFGFSLICAYPLHGFRGLDGLERFASICDQHDQVSAVPQNADSLGARHSARRLPRQIARDEEGDAVVRRLIRHLREPISSIARALSEIGDSQTDIAVRSALVGRAAAQIEDANRLIDVLLALATPEPAGDRVTGLSLVSG